MTSLTSLIERIEAATEGSRDIDADIYEAFGHEVIRRRKHISGISWKYRPGHGRWRTMERFSTSIDAALTLLPDGFEFEFTNLYSVAAVSMGINTESPCYARREDGNITLALLAAILRARQTEPRHDES